MCGLFHSRVFKYFFSQAKFTQLANHLDTVLDACVNGAAPAKSPRSQKMDELQAMLDSLKGN